MKTNKGRNITFVHTPCPELDDDRVEPPQGILSLASFMKENQIPCQICDLSGVPEEDWRSSLSAGDVYGFSTYSVNYHRTLRIRDIAKSINPDAITIAGGPHVSGIPRDCAKDFDVIIRGEAELALLDVMGRIQGGESVAGIFQADPVADLDQLPFPDYGMIDIRSYHRIVEGLPSISIVSSRGCPYNCPFCNSRVFSRGKLRFRSPGNVVREIRQLMDRYGTRTFRFNDDLFTFSPDRIAEMTAALKPLNILYRVFARSSSMTRQAAEQLYESGCRHVAIGTEHMAAKMLEILKQKTTQQDNIEALKNCKRAGLKVRIYLLLGFPGETEETIRESISVLLDCEFDEFIVYAFIPYPGTAMWSSPEIWGAEIVDRDFSKYLQVGRERRTCFAVKTDGADGFTPDDVRRWRQMTIDALEKKALWAGKSPDNR